jgi:ABC-type multidrug transport system fused ATPase/permease subunit
MSSSLITVGLAVVSQRIIDSATLGHKVSSGIMLYIGIVIISLILGGSSMFFSTIINEKFSFAIRKQIYDKVLNSCWLDISKYHTGDLMTRLTSDTNTIANGISSNIPTIIALVFEVFATFFTLLYYQPSLAFFAVLIAPLGAISSLWLGRKLKKMQMKVQESESKYRSFLQESLNNILVVKTFCEEDYYSQRLTELRNERLYWIKKKSKMSLIASTLISFAFQSGYILAFAWGSYMLSSKSITFGVMTVFLTLVGRIQAPLMGLANQIPQVVSILASTGRIIELQDIPSEQKMEPKLNQESIGVHIQDLSFGYSGENVLANTSLTILPGEFVAIVGESGIGKTTLVRLIMSFVTATNGKLSFYNSQGEYESLTAGCREFISYVPQGNTLFSGTISDNVRMGNRTATDIDVIKALQSSAAYNFVSELPDGIYTIIGEHGLGLSEGQAQRISIARALIKNAPFLILDEATSALDEATELEVLKNIKHITPNLTCLLITHRRSVIQYCSREIKIENKQLYEFDL